MKKVIVALTGILFFMSTNSQAQIESLNQNKKMEEKTIYQYKVLDIKGKEFDFETLRGKKILIVDDDVRNIFALTAALEQKGASIEVARNGREALNKLKDNPSVDLVLMDIMMPEMDGYETMRAIRKNSIFSHLPIIALTAKAMKGDREKCIDAGASDYISKPVDTEKLVEMLQVWLYRADEVQ